MSPALPPSPPPSPLFAPPYGSYPPTPMLGHIPILRPAPDNWEERVTGGYLVAYSSMASLTWLYWDVFRTLPQEVQVVWSARRSRVKYLYFFIRYMGIIQQGSSAIFSLRNTPTFPIHDPFCMGWQAFQTAAAFVISLAVEYVMMLRVFALYSSSRGVKRILIVLFILQAGIRLGSMVHFIPRSKYDANCAVTGTHETLLIYLTAFVLFHLFLFILTLAKFATALKAGWGTSRVMSLLMRDGTWSFFLLVASVLSCSLVLLFEVPPRTSLLCNWLGAAFSFVGYRNLLNTFQLSHCLNADSANTTMATSSIRHIFTTQYTREESFQDTLQDRQVESITSRG